LVARRGWEELRKKIKARVSAGKMENRKRANRTKEPTRGYDVPQSFKFRNYGKMPKGGQRKKFFARGGNLPVKRNWNNRAILKPELRQTEVPACCGVLYLMGTKKKLTPEEDRTRFGITRGTLRYQVERYV